MGAYFLYYENIFSVNSYTLHSLHDCRRHLLKLMFLEKYILYVYMKMLRFQPKLDFL